MQGIEANAAVGRKNYRRWENRWMEETRMAVATNEKKTPHITLAALLPTKCPCPS